MTEKLVVPFEMVEWEAGVWCDACALSTAVRLAFAVTSAGVTKMHSRVVCVRESSHE